MCLARWVLSLTCGQDLAQNGFTDIGFLYASALDECLEDRGSKVVCWSIGKCA
jgi:hypothetical protein